MARYRAITVKDDGSRDVVVVVDLGGRRCGYQSAHELPSCKEVWAER
jgi:hypothetical protein